MTVRAWTVFVLLCVIWGTPYFFIKLALAELSPVWIAWGRIALGAATLLPIAWHRGTLRAAWQHKWAVVGFGIAELVVPFFLISLGEQWISSSLAGVLIATTPLTIVLLAPLFGVREKMDARRLLGLAIGFIGVVVLLGIDTIAGVQQWLGVLCMVGGILGYAIGPLIVQRYLGEVDALGALAASLVFATIVMLPAVVPTAPSTMPSPLVLTSMLALGVLCTAVAMLMYFYLINVAGAARSSIVAYVNPGVAAVLGVFVLGEHFGIGMAVGLAMILFGSWLGAKGRTPLPEEPAG